MATNKFLYILNSFFGNFYGLKQVKIAFAKYKVCLSFNIRKIRLVVANKVHRLTTSNTPNRHFTLLVRKYSTIISNRPKWTKNSLNLFINLVSIGNFANTSYKHLRTKFRSLLNFVVNFIVNFELIKNPGAKSYTRNRVTSSVCLL